jgi:hypothetical protein
MSLLGDIGKEVFNHVLDDSQASEQELKHNIGTSMFFCTRGCPVRDLPTAHSTSIAITASLSCERSPLWHNLTCCFTRVCVQDSLELNLRNALTSRKSTKNIGFLMSAIDDAKRELAEARCAKLLAEMDVSHTGADDITEAVEDLSETYEVCLCSRPLYLPLPPHRTAPHRTARTLCSRAAAVAHPRPRCLRLRVQELKAAGDITLDAVLQLPQLLEGVQENQVCVCVCVCVCV